MKIVEDKGDTDKSNLSANLNKNFEAVKINNEENKKGESFSNSYYNVTTSFKCDIRSLRKEFSELKSTYKKSKLIFNNGQINDKFQELKKESIENPEYIKNKEINSKKNKAGLCVSQTYDIELKKNNVENENRNIHSKNYLEVPIDIDIFNIQSNADRNHNQQQNKENFNTINSNDNNDQQSISSFISNFI